MNFAERSTLSVDGEVTAMREAGIAIDDLDCGNGSVSWASSVPGKRADQLEFGSNASHGRPGTVFIAANVLLMFSAVRTSCRHPDHHGKFENGNEELVYSPASISALSQAFAKWMIRHKN